MGWLHLLINLSKLEFGQKGAAALLGGERRLHVGGGCGTLLEVAMSGRKISFGGGGVSGFILLVRGPQTIQRRAMCCASLHHFQRQ